MSDKHEIYKKNVDERWAKRQKRKEWRRSSGQHMNEAISERKQGIEQNVDHSAQTEPQRVDVGVQVMPKKRDAGTQTSAEGRDGNAIKGLLSDPSPEELACFLPAGELRDVLLQLMWGLRIVYSLSKARVLDEEALNKLEEWTKKFFDRWQWLKRFEPRVASNTPKLHWLCCHLTEFARRRRWFALVSEQCIEHIHSHFDRLAPRYKNTGSEEKTMMKLARHQAILNSLHALGHEDEGRNSDENESPTPIADENDPPSGRRMTQ
uniref:Uncharacterized protein n=1 Tax=Globodera pallida TaxID=36090 RepID=A0A183BWN3_GLOPA